MALSIFDTNIKRKISIVSKLTGIGDLPNTPKFQFFHDNTPPFNTFQVFVLDIPLTELELASFSSLYFRLEFDIKASNPIAPGVLAINAGALIYHPIIDGQNRILGDGKWFTGGVGNILTGDINDNKLYVFEGSFTQNNGVISQNGFEPPLPDVAPWSDNAAGDAVNFKPYETIVQYVQMLAPVESMGSTSTLQIYFTGGSAITNDGTEFFDDYNLYVEVE